MKEKAYDEGRMLRYLLGQLEGEDRRDLEREYFEDDDLFDRLTAFEQEMIRDYVRGELAPDLRTPFQERYLKIPELKGKVDRIRDLVELLARERTPLRRITLRMAATAWFRWTVPAAAMVCLSFAVWFGFRDAALQRRIGALERDVAARSSGTPVIAAFVLSPGTLRGGEGRPARLPIPPGAGLVRLELEFTPSRAYSRYRGILTTVEGRELARGELATESRPDRLVMTLNSATLGRGDYVLMLAGLSSDGKYEDLESYSFGVIGK